MAANLTTRTKGSLETRGPHQRVLGQLESSQPGPPCSPRDHSINLRLLHIEIRKMICTLQLRFIKLLRREGLSNILLKELPLEGYICEKYSKIGRYIALEKFKLNLIVMERTKARFSNESIFGRVKFARN